jgi:hypothetical protein
MSEAHYVNRQLLQINRPMTLSRCRIPAHLSHPLSTATPLYWLTSHTSSLDVTVALAKLNC